VNEARPFQSIHERTDIIDYGSRRRFLTVRFVSWGRSSAARNRMIAEP
jgi:hypothetical protein